jgi:hypothetical protein
MPLKGLPSQYTDAVKGRFYSDKGKGALVTKPPSNGYRLGPAPLTLTVGLLVVLSAHSHSESQFLPHLPKHSKSIMCPPHCGQTRLMIEEIMLAFTSPGIVSMCLIVSLPDLTKGVSSKSSPSYEKARRSQGPRTTVNLPRVSVAFKRSVLVGYGIRLGHLYRLSPRSVHHLASAMPMPNTRMRSLRASRVRTFWQAFGN